jgi:hypothetical protein
MIRGTRCRRRGPSDELSCVGCVPRTNTFPLSLRERGWGEGHCSRHSGESRNPGFKGNRLRRYLNRNDAAIRAAAGYSSLFAQRRVARRKHAPEPPKPPALLAPAGREPNSPSAKRRARLRHRLATPPGRGCDARRRLRVPTSTATSVTENRDIVCVGWVRRAVP